MSDRTVMQALIDSVVEMEAYNAVPDCLNDPVWLGIRERGAKALILVRAQESVDAARDGTNPSEDLEKPQRSERVDTDIVERARANDWWRGEWGAKEILCHELADEIERLRAAMESGNYLTTNDKLSLGIERQALEIKGLQDEIARLRTLPAPSEWRGIETAPKDGTEVLALWDKGGTHAVVSWFGDPEGWADANYDEVYISPPTHWQPLPAPPGKEKEGDS